MENTIEVWKIDSASPTSPNAPAIEKALQQLEKGIAELSHISAELDGRLSAVMREPEPVQIQRQKEDRGLNIVPEPRDHSRMTVTLLKHTQDIELITRRLAFILNRIEL